MSAAYAMGMTKTEQPTKATSTQQIIGTMEGHRAIVFDFTMKVGASARVVLDFYGAGANLNGATYARCESAALAAMGRADKLADVKTFTHTLVY